MNEAYGKKGARVIDRQDDLELVRYGIDAETESPLYMVYCYGRKLDWLDTIDCYCDLTYCDPDIIEQWQNTYL